MDRETLQKTIINMAQHDVFDGVGRVFLSEATKTLNISREEILKALKEARYNYRVSDDILLITFTPRPDQTKNFTFKQGARRYPAEEE